jgi:hypothetical protein
MEYLNTQTLIVPLSLYRHFKGKYFFVLTVAKNEETGKKEVVYQATDGSGAVWSRDYDDFIADISDKGDNTTGQTYRFQKVKLDNVRLGSLKNSTTENLVKELKTRSDNPYLIFADSEGQNDRILRIDHMVALVEEKFFNIDDSYTEVIPLVAEATRDEAIRYMSSHTLPARAKLVKVVYIEDSLT